MEDYNEPSTSKLSKINAAALINLTIAELWKDSYRHSRAGDLSKWNADLNCLWIELAGDVDIGSEEEKGFNKVEGDLIKLGSLGTSKVTGFVEKEEGEKIKNAKQYKLLMDKALFLKRLQNKQGKGTAYQDDADDYMD